MTSWISRVLVGGAAVAILSTPGTSQASTRPTFTHPPKMTINKNWHYTATAVSSDGTFTIGLLPRVAPLTVNNFVFLAQHRFFDGIKFHRVIKGFMVQTGDPTGTGMGGPGYTFKDERVTLPYTQGTVAMANSGPNTNGSQFFIVTGKRVSLPPSYTIFGKVTSGLNVVLKIAASPVGPDPSTQEKSSPLKAIKLIRVTIKVSK